MDQAEGLRNIIKAQNQKEILPARVLTVTSGKGGVGKSNLSVNLAVQLRKMGKKVIIFDADFGLANVEVMFGAFPQFNLSDLIYHGKSIQEILTKGPMDIEFISAGSGIAGLNNLDKDQISFLINNLTSLNTMADVIIIDTGAGISDSVMEFVVSSPEVLLVSTPEPSSLTDSYSLLKTLYSSPKFDPAVCKVKVISNKVLSKRDGLDVFNRLNTVVGQFLSGNLEYIGMIPQDTELEKAIREQKPVSMRYPNAKSSIAFRDIAMSLFDEKIGDNVRQPRRSLSQMFADLLYGHR